MWAIVSDVTGAVYASDFGSDFDAMDALDTATYPDDAVIAFVN